MHELNAITIDNYIRMLENPGKLSTTKLDDASEELLRKLYRVTLQLEVMGDDERRNLWISAPSGSFEEYVQAESSEDEDVDVEKLRMWFEEDYPEDVKWYHFSSTYYMNPNTKEEFITMGLGGSWNLAIDPRSKSDYPIDVTDLIQWLIEKVNEVVDEVKQGEYNKRVRSELPAKYKYGVISRSDYWDIYPELRNEYRGRLSESEIEEFLGYKDEIVNKKFVPDNCVDRMTTRLYFEACAAGYREMGFESRSKWRFTDTEDEHDKYGEDTPREIYGMYADGRDNGLTNVPLDDPAEFEKWNRKEGNYYVFNGNHPWEIVTSFSLRYSIHLYPEQDRESGKWFFSVSGDADDTSILTIRFFLGLKRAGFPITLINGKSIAARLDETDMIGILPEFIPSYYCLYGSSILGYDVLDLVNLNDREKPDMVVLKAVWEEPEEVRLSRIDEGDDEDD